MFPLDVLDMLLKEGGVWMPWLLLTTTLGWLLMTERLLTWLIWWRAEGTLRKRKDEGAELSVSGWPATPLGRLLAESCEMQRLQGEISLAGREHLVLRRLPELEARLATLAWIASILPMLGLLGTVSGMIATMQELSGEASRQVLSAGLGQALWSTEVGLAGALPLLATHHILSRLRMRWLEGLDDWWEVIEKKGFCQQHE